MKYKLFNYKGEEIKGVTIDESAKEDFKKMMDWTEKEWYFHTMKMY